MAAFLSMLTITTLAAPKQIMLGPTDGDAESGGQWYSGSIGEAYLSVNNSAPNHGNNAFLLGNKIAGDTNRADWRSQLFELGPAAGGAERMTLTFAYMFPGKVNPHDDIAVFFRFFDETGTNFLGQHYIPLGSSSGDSGMTEYKTVTMADLRAVKNAAGIRLPKGARAMTADIWITCNIFSPWTSGDALFDDFSVTTVPGPSWLSRHWVVSLTIVMLVVVAAATVTVLAMRRHRSA